MLINHKYGATTKMTVKLVLLGALGLGLGLVIAFQMAVHIIILSITAVEMQWLANI